LSALQGQKNVLLTFFPKCFTGGCATHLSSLRDRQANFDAAQTQILAVSTDPADGDQGQLAFARQWGFRFPMIPDTARQLSRRYGAIQNDDERAARLSVLIDKKGIVRWIDTQIQVGTHGADMLARIQELGLAR
jgi:peroxiredoxin Q/BCP